MKAQSVIINLGLGVFGSLLLGTISPHGSINSGKVLAQTASCPLSDPNIVVTFLNSECKKVTLTTDQVFYRYYGNSVSKYGRYLTSDQFAKTSEAIKGLALNQAWGNPANKRAKVTLPAGTIIYQGIAAPQTPSDCYPGGAQQTFIENSKDPQIKWEEDGEITIDPFCCSVPK